MADTEASDIPPGRRPWWIVLAILALLCGAAGAAMLTLAPEPPLRVTSIRVSPKPGIDLSGVVPRFDTPDLYVKLITDAGELRSEVRHDTVIGSGLSLSLPHETPLAEIREVQVWDKDPLKDNLMDRCDRPAEACDGAKFQLDLAGVREANRLRPAAWIALAAAGALLIGTVLLLVRAQALPATGGAGSR